MNTIMITKITIPMLIEAGVDAPEAAHWSAVINDLLEHHHSAEIAWQHLSEQMTAQHCPFKTQHAMFTSLFPSWREHPDAAPVWIPKPNDINNANLTPFMTELGLNTVAEFHAYTRQNSHDFWHQMLTKLNIRFQVPPAQICDLSHGITAPNWLPGAKMNIVESCFNADETATALIFEDTHHQLTTMTYRELNQLSNQIANSLLASGFKTGDSIAIVMPMNQYAVAAYLGIIKMGGIVVSIADSFSPLEISTRLRIAQAVGVFTQDYSPWGNKRIPIYEKIIAAQAPRAIVISTSIDTDIILRPDDQHYTDFLLANTSFTAVACNPMDACNILFSSGTTADPKAIPWNHTTPIKSASDAYFHQNIQPGDILTWPTNLGWMMGPWLIFAALINRAAIALYTGAPKDREFGNFVAKAGVTMLGVVPTLVATWRQSQCMEGLDWSCLKAFSSTGECSNAEDMFYLMWLGGYKPVIEYCGGTEIGGAYISSTMVQPNFASLFTTPTMGSDFTILSEEGLPADIGEVALIPPALGLSVKLLNAEHDKVYYQGMPSLDGIPLRRHGDQISRLAHHTFAILGRVDDTMNLGGIKVSAAEIERAIADLHPIRETAAIAIKPLDNGPSQLVIYAAIDNPPEDKLIVMQQMQKRINQALNPLFKIHDLVFVTDLPKTASNKIMRRVLRKEYMNQ